MQKTLILLFSSYFLCFGCSSKDEFINKKFYKDYKVIDRGGNNVIVISKACSISHAKANLEAKRSAEYHLRSVVGGNTFKKKFREIRKFYRGKEVCVEILAEGSNHL